MLRACGVICVLVVLALPTAAGADGSVLTAVTGPGAKGMTFVGPDGKPFTHLDPGTYTIHVSDTSDARDFSLRGPGVSLHTGFMETGDQTWTATFTTGWYRYYDAAFETDIHGQFTVGTPPPPTLTARIGIGFITFRHSDGSAVKKLDPGTYSIAVHDSTSGDGFHLMGPGVEEHTQVNPTVDYIWTVTFGDGRYSFYRERDPAKGGSFVVGAAPPLSKRKLLRAVTGPDFSITVVDANWRPVTRLVAGTYTLSVVDTGPDHNFHLSGPRIDLATTVPFVGTKTWTIRLRAGSYFYRCDPHSIMFGSFAVKAAKKSRH
ncbi:MAG TPA: hypothetical protein VGA62_01645 [Acidimicrobiia bacterium]